MFSNQNLYLIVQVTEIFNILNYSIHFFLYSVSGINKHSYYKYDIFKLLNLI
jgi:hypothetical protein